MANEANYPAKYTDADVTNGFVDPNGEIVNFIPPFTAEYDGRVLGVDNGRLAWVELPSSK